MERKRGTFVVTHADDATAVLRDAETAQIHTVQGDRDFAVDDVVEATIEPVGRAGVAWQIAEVEARREVTVERSEEPPTRHEREVAADQSVGELTRVERAGTGELHVITVPADEVEQAVADVLDDEAGLLARAARLGVGRVEVRAGELSAGDEGNGGSPAGEEADVDLSAGETGDGDPSAGDERAGVVSVRYLP